MRALSAAAVLLLTISTQTARAEVSPPVPIELPTSAGPTGVRPVAARIPLQLAPSKPASATRRHSSKLMGGGIAMVVLGAASLAGAIAVFVVDDAPHCTPTGSPCGVASMMLGLPLTLNAVGMAAAGVGMIMVGKRQVPIEPPPGEAQPSAAPRVSIGPGSAALAWRF